jgi:hypothetical protein
MPRQLLVLPNIEGKLVTNEAIPILKKFVQALCRFQHGQHKS